MKKHIPKFTTSKRGKATKYYTCKVCGECFVSHNLKDAKEQHKSLFDKK